MDKDQEAIAGEDLRKGDVLTVWKEGEGDAYAYAYKPANKKMTAEGIADRDAKKGERVKVGKLDFHPFYGINTGGYYRP